MNVPKPAPVLSMKDADLTKTKRSLPPSLLPSATTQTAYFVTGAFAGLCTIPVEYFLKLGSHISTKPTTTTTATARTIPSPVAYLRSHPASTYYRPALRFWVFSLTRSALQRLWPPPSPSPANATPEKDTTSTITTSSGPSTNHFRTALIGGLSGAVGGFSELAIPALLSRPINSVRAQSSNLSASALALPTITALTSQSSKLFLCFGTYTLLSSLYSGSAQPPRPFWKCWAMGAAAGAVGSAIVAGVEQGVRLSSRSPGLGLWGLLGVAGKGACVIGTVIGVQVTSCADVLESIGKR